MKLTLFMTIFAALSVSANVNLLAQRVNLDFRNAALSEVFRSLKAQTGHMIIYSEDKVEAEKARVSVSLKDVALSKALDEILRDLPYTYVIEDRSVMIVPAPAKTQQAPREVTVAGRIADSDNQPLAGATVIVPGTTRGAATDASGRFSFTVPYRQGMVLRVSYVGKKDVEVAYNGQPVDVRMENLVSQVEEVVVTGYQRISREKVTGSASVIDSKELLERYTPSLVSNLEGKVAGLVTYDGKMSIRGASSLSANTNPLLVVDGLPVEGKLEDLNPYDVESITVLKDAAATAIYGARASNGIIVVTTKKAREVGRISVDVSANITVYRKANVDYADNFLMTPAQQVAAEKDFWDFYYFEKQGGKVSNPIGDTQSAIDKGSSISPIQYAYFQWAKGLTTQAEVDKLTDRLSKNNFAKEYAENALLNRLLQQYNVAIRSMSDNFESNLVVNYKHDNTGIIHAGEDQVTIFYKGSYKMAKWVTMNFGVNGILQNAKSKTRYDGEITGTTTYDAFMAPAYYRLLNDDGSYTSYNKNNYNNQYNTFEGNSKLRPMHFNHLQELAYDQTKADRQNMRYNGELLFNVIQGLNVSTQFLYETERSTQSSYAEADSYVMRLMRNVYTVKSGDVYTYMIPENGGKLASTNTKGDFWTARGQLNFNRTFCGRHAVDFLAGLEFRQSRTKGTSGLLLGYDDQLQSHNTSTVNFKTLYDMERTSWFYPGYSARHYQYNRWISPFIGPVIEQFHRFGSGYANATYTYDGRYNAFASFRKDYADVYGLDAKFRGKPLWSAGLSWNVTGERFMENVDWVNYLKARASYGVTGNIYQGATSYMTANSTGTNSHTNQPLSIIESPGNPNLTWEQTRTTNVGLDFALLDNRLRGAIDWYHKDGVDILARKTLESTTGYASLVMNMASLTNDGIELALSYDWFRAADRNRFGWTTSLTAAYNYNEITNVETQATMAWEMVNPENPQYQKGYPVHALFSYRFAGLDKETGVKTWHASDGSVQTTTNIQNTGIEALVYSGQTDPKVTAGMENRLTYKGFSLNVMAAYYGGHKMRALQPNPAYGAVPVNYLPMPGYLLRSWTPENPDTNVPGAFRYNNTSITSDVDHLADVDVHAADFIKVRNIVFGYDFSRDMLQKIGLYNVSLRFQIDNPRTVWMKNTLEVDPETGGVRRPTSCIFGLNFNF